MTVTQNVDTTTRQHKENKITWQQNIKIQSKRRQK